MNAQPGCLVATAPNMWLGVDLGHKPLHTTVTLLNRGKSGSPWFFVHDVLGDAQQYATLAYFCKAPLYGLGLAADSPLGSVDELVEKHLASIKSVQAAGPYVIGGYSLGGFIAMKIVAALEAAGETVTKLLLVDIFGNQMHKTKLPAMDHPHTRVGYCGLRSFMPHASKALADQLIYALEHCSLETTHRLVCDMAQHHPKCFDPLVLKSPKLLFALVRSTHARWKGLFGAVPSSIRAATWLVRISDSERQALNRHLGLPPGVVDEDLGLRDLCSDLRDISYLKGDHFGIFSAARVEELVAALSVHLQ